MSFFISCLFSDVNSLDFNDYPIHVITSATKTFFRDLPEPLLTYDLYDEFIRVSEIRDPKERLQATYSVIEVLPKANFDLFERLIFHLAR